jgi:hypothetical protein
MRFTPILAGCGNYFSNHFPLPRGKIISRSPLHGQHTWYVGLNRRTTSSPNVSSATARLYRSFLRLSGCSPPNRCPLTKKRYSRPVQSYRPYPPTRWGDWF